MNKDRVKSIIDNRVISLFQEGNSIQFVIKELASRADKFINVLEKDDINLWEAISNVESLKSTRHKYSAFYVISAYKRVSDLKWMHNNKHKFRHIENSKFFKLIQFRDKISKENSLPF
jgi:glycyl-tRNA synthetase beta subunit